MKYYFKEDAKNWPLWKEPGNGDLMPAPVTKEAQDELVDRLQDVKTEYYKILLEEVATPRPGIIELMDEAIKDPRIKVCYHDNYNTSCLQNIEFIYDAIES